MYTVDSSKVFAKKLGEKVVLLNIATGAYFTLEDVGVLIWEGLSSGQKGDAIVTSILNQYRVDEQVVRRDYDELVERLLSAGLIQPGSIG